jgi:Protein of unknown function (DUF3048) N-terminal domain/Protein of unknown function (DUF3048) C-terminal domain
VRASAPHRRTGTGLACVVVSLVVIAAACGGGGSDKKAAAKPKQTSTTTTTLAPPIAPLTGLPDPSGASRTRPALIIKIENTPEARPQTGLESADVVYEEVVDGGITRFFTVFNSTLPETVGPIRSVRPIDASLSQQLGGLFAYSGGIQEEIDRISAVPSLIPINETKAGDAMFRESSRQAPHNLYGYPAKFLTFGGAPVPPQPLFAYLGAGQTFTGDPVESFTVAESPDGGYNPSYTWDATSGTWLRSVQGEPSMMASGVQIAPTNVVVQFTTYDPQPGASGATGIVTGSGEVWVFTDGKLAKGTWTRTDPAKPATYADAAGKPIKLAPGRTWVELAAFGAQTQVVSPPPPATTAPTAPAASTSTTKAKKKSS